MPTTLEQLRTEFEALARGVADQAMVDRSARLLDQLALEHPVAHKLITGLIDKNPDQIADALGLFSPDVRRHRKNPNVTDYLGRVKTALKELRDGRGTGTSRTR
jgi:hypothetical protein